MNNLGQLPVEIISLILSYAYDHLEYALINKRFYSVASVLIWKNVSITNNTSLLKFFASLVEPSRPLSSGRIQEFEVSIQKLVIWEGKYLTDASYQYLSRHCPKLRHLVLQDARITPTTLESLGKRCHQLESLSLRNYHGPPSTVFSALASCPLKTLNIEFVFDNDDDEPNELDAHTAMEIALDIAEFECLEDLGLTCIDETLTRHIFTITANRAGNKPWPHLTHIFLNDCDAVDDDSMIAFVRNHPKLVNFALHNNYFSDAVLVATSTCLPALDTLILSGTDFFTEHAIRRVIHRCPSLVTFGFSNSEFTTIDFPELCDDSDSANDVYELWGDDIKKIRLTGLNYPGNIDRQAVTNVDSTTTTTTTTTNVL